jgi:hypothetical protein
MEKSSSSSSADKVKKTRNRVPTSCDHCRKRKLKCDRQKPCGNCTKSQTEELCKYAASAKSTSNILPKVNLNNELIKLKLQINKLERILQMNNIDISNYSNIMPEISNNDSDTDQENDPMVSLSNQFDSMIIKENKILHSGTTSYVTFIVQDKQLAKIFEAYKKRHLLVYESYKEKQKIKASEFPINFSQNHLSWLTANARSEASACDIDNTSSIHFTTMDPPNAVSNMQAKLVLDIIDDINKRLPPLYVVNVLVNHFFKFVYPLLPLINEETFKEELTLVLVPTENGGCKVAITHLQNATIISLLLLILRYAYLAVNFKDYGEDNKAIGNEFLVAMIKSGHVIDSSFILSAKNLLMALPGDDSIFKKITLRNIQVLLFLRLYQTYSPEMHEENREHSLTLALIIQMCRSLGTNRDPSNFPHIFKDEREITVWRRIFYKLLTLDVQNAFEYGCSLIISDNEFDVKLPTLSDRELQALSDFKKGLSVTKSGDEIKKLVIENAINKDTALEFEAVKLMREGLDAFQNFKCSTKRSQLLRIAERLQQFIDYKISSLWEFLQDNSISNQLERLFDVPRVRKFEIRLTAQTVLMGFYYLLYLNDENNNDDDCYEDDISPGNIDETENDTEKQKKVHTYVARATELALTNLKMNYDYTKYITSSPTLHGDSKQYKAFKYFSAKCDVFILNRIATSFLRPFFFLCSFFLKNLNGNGNNSPGNEINESKFTVSIFMKNFSNTVDATVALKWFNLNIALKNNDGTGIEKESVEFCFLLFQYVKDLFFMSYGLKNEYFICWRNTMIIKLFINFFKSSNYNKCSEFLHPTLVNNGNNDDDLFNTGEDCPFSLGTEPSSISHNESVSTNDILTDSPPTVTTTGSANNLDQLGKGSVDNNFMDEFLNTVVPISNNFTNTGNNLDALIYENIDHMIDDIFQDTEEQYRMRELGLFNNNTSGGNVFGDIMDTNLNELPSEKDKVEADVNRVANIIGSKSSVSNSDHYTGMTNRSENSSIRTPDMFDINNSINFGMDDGLGGINNLDKNVKLNASVSENNNHNNNHKGMFY